MADKKASKPRPNTTRAASSKSRTSRNGKKKRPILKRALFGGLVALLVLSLMGIGSFIYLYATTDLPDPHADFQTNTTFIYYADGETQLGSLMVQNRVSLTYDEIPDVVKESVVAAENRSFWEDPGFSITGILRSVWSIATGGGLQGGSTITQQYIKILYLDSEQTLQRKVRELILAIKMGREMPKEDILTGYLNTIYYGRGAYGIEAAANSFFLKSAGDLSVDEAAALAAILNNPARFNPSSGEEHRERLLQRYRYVLDGMREMGTISQTDYDQAHTQLPEFPEVATNDRYGGPTGFLISMVEDELAEQGFEQAEIQGGGLRIITTVDARLQEAAVEAAQNYTEEAAANSPDGALDPSELHVAISSVDTSTGAILAHYGGPDYVASQRNWATTPRPAASTFKAYAAVAGLRNGYNLDSVFTGDTFTPPGDPSPVRNQGETQYGDVTLRRAMALSINTAFVDLTMDMPNGPQQVIEAAIATGAPQGPGWDANSRISLGAAEVSPLDIANSYGTLVDSGRLKPTHIVSEVRDSRGNAIYTADVDPQQAIDSNLAANVTDGLVGVVTDGTGRRAAELGRPVAAKTGTNSDGQGNITSAWFVGATRQISTAVMFVAGEGGNADLVPYRQPGDRTFFGSGYPLSTWLSYMLVATDGQEVLGFDEPQDIDADRGRSPEASPSEVETTEEPEPEETTESPTPSPTEIVPDSPSPEPEETTPEPEETTPQEVTPEPTDLEEEPPVETDPPVEEEGEADQGQGGVAQNTTTRGAGQGDGTDRAPQPTPTG